MTEEAGRDDTVAKVEQRPEESDLGTFLAGQGAGRSRVKLAPGQTAYPQGGDADAMFYIESGWIKISVVVPSGKEAVIAIRGDGEFFGTRCLIGRRTGSAIALTACSLVRIPRPTLIRLLREEPDFAVMFVTHLVQQSIQDQENLVDHLTNPAEKRLARALLRLADGVDGAVPRSITTRINQALLAAMIGTTRPRVSFFMNKFKRQGLIEYNRDGSLTVRAGLRGFLLGR